MGIDNQNERRSAISLLMYSLNPVPTGIADALGRKQSAGVFADFITSPSDFSGSNKRRAAPGILLYSVNPVPDGSLNTQDRRQASGTYYESPLSATQLISTQPGASSDYLPYILSNPVKTAKVNKPTLLDFSLAPWNDSFVKLERGAYIKLNTATYGVWYSGYITNEPELEYLGTLSNVGVWGYKYQATSDEYYLNLKPLGFMPPFVNTTQGAVLKALANRLAPGMFDTSGIQDGQVIARFVVDPQSRFSDVVNSFTAGWYTFWARDKKLYFQSQDSVASPLTLDGHNKYFTPINLSLSPSSDPVYNDAIVLGLVEPQDYCNEYFVGDGVTGKFPLLWAAFGADSTVFLDDDFSSSQIDTTKWAVFDQPANYIKVSNGYVNTLHGPQDNSYDTYLASANLIPLEGSLRLTHGSWDFVSASDGVICSLWESSPASDLSGCFYGIKCSKSGTSTVLNPIVNGVADASQSFTISSYNNRYIFRTLCNFNLAHRVDNSYTYATPSGSVGTYGGGGKADIVTFNTWIVEIDPQTGFVLQEVKWTNAGAQLTADEYYALYVPCVLNDLNAAFTDVTLSVPQMASLQIKSKDSSTWSTKIVGPNELDSLDGMAPIAAIIDANNGTTTKSSLLGTPQYNPGSASLQFFKDTTKLISGIPQVGDVVRLSYRRAASAVGRSRLNNVVASESAAWGDDGIRTITRLDLKPVPRNSSECDMAAAALVQDQSYQHYNGTYSQWSMLEFTSEPIPGPFVRFANLPAPTFPSDLQAMPISGVQSTFAALQGGEKFYHTVTFGQPDDLDKVLNKFITQSDVFLNNDSVEIPIAIDASSAGLSYSPDVVSASLVNWDANNINFSTNQDAPSGGGFEVRYSDKSWGADDGMNLVARITGRTFSVHRNFQATQLFVRAQDGRNKLLYSEDLTNATWVKSVATASQVATTDPDSNQAQVSSVAFPDGTALVKQDSSIALASTNFSFSVSVKGVAGNKITLRIDGSDGTTHGVATFTLNGFWQRISVPSSLGAGVVGTAVAVVANGESTAQTVQVSRASLEVGQTTETVYCKTNATIYGALSRFPASFHIAFPLKPAAPTGTIDMGDPTAPVLTITFPADMEYMWGYEVRASDNTTVLVHQDLINVGVTSTATYTQKNNTNENPVFYIYTYNIFGEYSDSVGVSFSYPLPVISGVLVDENHRRVVWTSTDADSYRVEIDPVDNTFTHDEIDVKVSDQFYTLGSNAEFYALRYIRITPLFVPLSLQGNPAVISHQYTPIAVSELTSAEVSTVPAPPTPTTDPTLPASVAPYSSTVLETAWRNYQTNHKRYN